MFPSTFNSPVFLSITPKSPICSGKGGDDDALRNGRRRWRGRSANLEDLWRVPVGPFEGGLIDQIDEIAQ